MYFFVDVCFCVLETEVWALLSLTKTLAALMDGLMQCVNARHLWEDGEIQL